MLVSNLSIYYRYIRKMEIYLEKFKKSYKNKKFKISAPIWNEEFELPDRWFSVSNIQDYLKYNNNNNINNSITMMMMIYVNKIENRITFKIKTEYIILHF